MKNKFLLSAFSLSLILSVNNSYAATDLHEDFVIFHSVKKCPDYENNPIRKEEEMLRANYTTVEAAAKVASKEAGEEAKSWWTWGATNLKAASVPMITNGDIFTKVCGVVGWTLGYVGDKLGDVIKTRAENSVYANSVKTGIAVVDATSTINYSKDYVLTSEIGGLTDLEMKQDVSSIKAVAF